MGTEPGEHRWVVLGGREGDKNRFGPTFSFLPEGKGARKETRENLLDVFCKVSNLWPFPVGKPWRAEGAEWEGGVMKETVIGNHGRCICMVHGHQLLWMLQVYFRCFGANFLNFRLFFLVLLLNLTALVVVDFFSAEAYRVRGLHTQT